MGGNVRIAMWSGPRNISTAMMRAWDSRADTVVMDEPFYGAYLATTGLTHPMREEILAAHPTDWNEIADACVAGSGAPITYQKHMCQHMVAAAPLGWMRHVRHAFLIRPPSEVAASFRQKWDEMSADDIGFRRQAELFDHVCQLFGQPPPVVLARDVLTAPGPMLEALCAELGVPYDAAMLSWEPGPRTTDGVWGAHWYGAVKQSRGFSTPHPAVEPPAALSRLIEECQPFYDRLVRFKIEPIEVTGA